MVITLVCNLGMSTSILVDKLIKYAAEKGIEADVEARAFQRIEDRIHDTDILLIGPQVRFMTKQFEEKYGNEVPVIMVMDMSDYALTRADKIFDRAYEEYQKKQ
ncbi:PTS system, cellobiose-specific IIB component [Lachnospiraceae bacterium G11]|nr:PTS sugar transporter subunit IIB [Lachnospiraceae bacterium]SDA74715.1 PTS system, cellobiose-specific IIB component [Lachnospiraceae bacterium G11]